MLLRRWKWPLIASIVFISIVNSFDWNLADASLLGQTVPTVTPSVEPSATPISTATAIASPQPVEPEEPVDEVSASNEDDVEQAQVVLLPKAGRRNSVLAVLLIIGGIFLMLAVGRQQTIRRYK